jgi:hypothetical protein
VKYLSIGFLPSVEFRPQVRTRFGVESEVFDSSIEALSLRLDGDYT